MARVIDWNKTLFYASTAGMMIGGFIGVHFLEERAVVVKEMWKTNLEREINFMKKDIVRLQNKQGLALNEDISGTESQMAEAQMDISPQNGSPR